MWRLRARRDVALWQRTGIEREQSETMENDVSAAEVVRAVISQLHRSTRLQKHDCTIVRLSVQSQITLLITTVSMYSVTRVIKNNNRDCVFFDFQVCSLWQKHTIYYKLKNCLDGTNPFKMCAVNVVILISLIELHISFFPNSIGGRKKYDEYPRMLI